MNEQAVGEALGLVIVTVLSFFIGYAVMAFGIGALNPMSWSVAARFLMVGLGGLVLAIWTGKLTWYEQRPEAK
jgi:protein-S-isoprenylcysteine O-methyltransferase Ste14